ncbi:class F sortase [Candidatus Saccharibacteria bacterium]|nr:class F sortase [Candidatus Saccharibacteria bacterium]
MSLKIKGWRSIVKWSVWAILGVLFLVFFIRVATFEGSYYSEKEGSERAVAEVNNDNDELIEVKPTDDEVKEYVVAADRPRYLSVEKLGVVKARVLPMGVNSSGELDTPNNIFDVGWYDGSGKPGQGGTMIIDGHNGGPHVHGVFKNLPDLAKGDIITVQRGDGEIFNYEVVENTSVSLDDSNEYMKTAARTPVAGKESVTLISCTGEWSQSKGTYLSRQFTRAVLVED